MLHNWWLLREWMSFLVTLCKRIHIVHDIKLTKNICLFLAAVIVVRTSHEDTPQGNNDCELN